LSKITLATTIIHQRDPTQSEIRNFKKVFI
jgi:hypothetical protein